MMILDYYIHDRVYLVKILQQRSESLSVVDRRIIVYRPVTITSVPCMTV